MGALYGSDLGIVHGLRQRCSAHGRTLPPQKEPYEEHVRVSRVKTHKKTFVGRPFISITIRCISNLKGRKEACHSECNQINLLLPSKEQMSKKCQIYNQRRSGEQQFYGSGRSCSRYRAYLKHLETYLADCQEKEKACKW